MGVLTKLQNAYQAERDINLNHEQFIYLVNLFPALLVVMSDGIVDRDEWTTVKKLAHILGVEFASEDFGEEKEENLTLIYRSEFKYLLKNLEEWKEKFLDGLVKYFTENDGSKDFVLETMYLFANASEGISSREDQAIDELSLRLGLS